LRGFRVKKISFREATDEESSFKKGLYDLRENPYEEGGDSEKLLYYEKSSVPRPKKRFLKGRGTLPSRIGSSLHTRTTREKDRDILRNGRVSLKSLLLKLFRHGRKERGGDEVSLRGGRKGLIHLVEKKSSTEKKKKICPKTERRRGGEDVFYTLEEGRTSLPSERGRRSIRRNYEKREKRAAHPRNSSEKGDLSTKLIGSLSRPVEKKDVGNGSIPARSAIGEGEGVNALLLPGKRCLILSCMNLPKATRKKRGGEEDYKSPTSLSKERRRGGEKSIA